MMYKSLSRIATTLFVAHLTTTYALTTDITTPLPYYVGIISGYGSTTWRQLVPKTNQHSVAMAMSTPTHVDEGGIIWGLFGGYEFSKTFAIEGSYTHYPSARVYFDPTSLFTFEHGLTEFTTSTEALSISGKLMMPFRQTALRIFSSVGAAALHRHDVVTNRLRLSPTFGVGINYPITQRIFLEAGITYTGGYGESELDPAEDYVPFLYAGFLHIAWRL